MKENWNGNGAPGFSSSLMDRIEALINELNIQPEIFPTALSTIQLEYDNSRKDHMERVYPLTVEITEAKRLSYQK